MMKKGALNNLIFRKIPIEILITIKQNSSNAYESLVAKEIYCTYSHILKVLNKFEALGIVRMERKGRVKKITLTKEGEDIVSILMEINGRFDRIECERRKQ